MTSHENVRHVRAQGELTCHLIKIPCFLYLSVSLSVSFNLFYLPFRFSFFSLCFQSLFICISISISLFFSLSYFCVLSSISHQFRSFHLCQLDSLNLFSVYFHIFSLVIQKTEGSHEKKKTILHFVVPCS